MNIHEYQAKQLFKQYGVRVPNGKPAFSADEAVAAAEEIGGSLWVVKAQIHAGGRGKAGGVKLARSFDEVRAIATELLGKTLVTHQTGPEGQVVRRIYVEEGASIARELYLAFVVDREAGRVMVMASTEGGMDIEEVAEATPEKITYTECHPVVGLADFQARQIAFSLGLEGKTVNAAVRFLKGLYRAFVEKDMSMLEVNPLIVTTDGELIALDAKVNFDSNGLYRQKDVVELRDTDEEDATEIEASKHDLAFIKLDGTIGCMVNGAGLAMATMDIIEHYGASPANFLDVGGGATTEKVTAAFKIIMNDPNVKGIFVNIFGGIMKCDVIAEGIVAAVKTVGLEVPLVVRLEGTNVERGKQILAESGLNLIPADGMADGAQKIIAAIQ